jgi:hypothetical protein
LKHCLKRIHPALNRHGVLLLSGELGGCSLRLLFALSLVKRKFCLPLGLLYLALLIFARHLSLAEHLGGALGGGFEPKGVAFGAVVGGAGWR